MYYCDTCFEHYKEWRRSCGAEICTICVLAAKSFFVEHTQCEYAACKGLMTLAEDNGLFD